MLFIDLLVLVLHIMHKILQETGRIKARKNSKVTEPKFSNTTALNGLAKFYCIIILADHTLQSCIGVGRGGWGGGWGGWGGGGGGGRPPII